MTVKREHLIQIDNKLYQKCKVHLLPIKREITYRVNQGDIYLDKNKLYINSKSNHNYHKELCNPQHIYITSDEEIKEDDWYLYWLDNKWELMKCRDQFEADNCNTHSMIASNCYKIIATTDQSLELPQIPQSFIEMFITEYNKGNVIEDVMVEYTDIHHICGLQGFNPNLKDKCPACDKEESIPIFTTDNTINISLIKDSYTHLEVCQIVRDVCNVLGVDSQYARDYIKENL